jgi:hypothetical protein
MNNDHGVNRNLQHSIETVSSATGTNSSEAIAPATSVGILTTSNACSTKSTTTSQSKQSKRKSKTSLLERTLLRTKQGSKKMMMILPTTNDSIPTRSDSVIIPTRLANAKVALATHIDQDQEQLLSDPYMIQPQDVVCCERGMKDTYEQHAGNQQFVTFIEKHSSEYHTTTSRYNRIQIVRSIVDSVRQLGGNFVRYDTSRKVWYDIGNMKAREKASHSLRAIIAKQYGNSRPREIRQSPRKKRKRTNGHHDATQQETIDDTSGQSSCTTMICAVRDPGSFDQNPTGKDHNNVTEKSVTAVSSETESSQTTTDNIKGTPMIDLPSSQPTIEQQLQEQLDLQTMLEQTLREQRMIRIQLENEVQRTLQYQSGENSANLHGHHSTRATGESPSSLFSTLHVSSSDTNITLLPNPNLSIYGLRNPEEHHRMSPISNQDTNNMMPSSSPMSIRTIFQNNNADHTVSMRTNLELIRLSHHRLEPNPILFWPFSTTHASSRMAMIQPNNHYSDDNNPTPSSADIVHHTNQRSGYKTYKK